MGREDRLTNFNLHSHFLRCLLSYVQPLLYLCRTFVDLCRTFEPPSARPYCTYAIGFPFLCDIIATALVYRWPHCPPLPHLSRFFSSDYSIYSAQIFSVLIVYRWSDAHRCRSFLDFILDYLIQSSLILSMSLSFPWLIVNPLPHLCCITKKLMQLGLELIEPSLHLC